MRARIATLATALLAGAVVLGTAVPATAHSAIVASTPAEGETLTELPEAFSVTANETLLDLGGQGVFALQVRDAAGRYYGDGCVRVVDATMSADAAIGPSGEYTMLWQIVSADGHPVSGEIPFTWQAPEGFEPATASDSPAVCGEDPGAAPPPSPGPGGIPVLGIGIGIALAGVLAAAIAAGVVLMRRRRAARPE